MSEWPYPSPDVIRHESAVILEEIAKVWAKSLDESGFRDPAQAIRKVAEYASECIRRGDPDWLPPHSG